MTSTKKLTIIGLGWLGQSLAQDALNKNHNVIGTVRTREKANNLSSALSMHIIDYDCYSTFPISKQRDFFENRTVIINIAAGRSQMNANKYSNAITRLIKIAFDSGADRLIFISTTSVFGSLTGNITNKTSPSPTTESGLAHTAIEAFLMHNYEKNSAVLRLAGLVGPNTLTDYRHPIFCLSKRGIVNASNHPVNLVHKTDVIEAICALLEPKEALSNIHNLCALEHPSKRDYYSWCTEKLSLPLPKFIASKEVGRTIDPVDTLKDLNITLKFPTPYDMLPD